MAEGTASISEVQDGSPPQQQSAVVAETHAGGATDAPAATPEDQLPPAPGSNQVDQAAAARIAQRKGEVLIGLVVNGKLDMTQLPLVQDLGPSEVERINFLLEKQVVTKDTLAEFLKLPQDQQQEQYTKEIIIDQMIKDELFTEEDRAELREKELESLRLSFGARQQTALGKDFVLGDEDSAINRDRPSNTLPNVNDMENGLTWKDVSKDPEVAKTFLSWTGKGGVIDQAIGVAIEPRIQRELDAELEKEAHQAFRVMEPEERITRKLLKTDGEALSEEDFVKAYIAQELANGDYIENRLQKVHDLVQQEVNNARGRIQEDNVEEGMKKLFGIRELSEEDRALLKKVADSLKALPAILREQLKIASNEAIDRTFDNDFMTFLNLLVSADSAYRNYRAIGTSSTEDGEQVRLIGKENFENALSYPESFGKALSQAYQKREFLEAGFRVDPPETFAAAEHGDRTAIRQIMEQMLRQLFDDEEPKMETRWKAARRYLPEAIFPGIHARLEDSMKDYLQNLHKDGAALDKVFPKTAPATTSATS